MSPGPPCRCGLLGTGVTPRSEVTGSVSSSIVADGTRDGELSDFSSRGTVLSTAGALYLAAVGPLHTAGWLSHDRQICCSRNSQLLICGLARICWRQREASRTQQADYQGANSKRLQHRSVSSHRVGPLRTSQDRRQHSSPTRVLYLLGCSARQFLHRSMNYPVLHSAVTDSRHTVFSLQTAHSCQTQPPEVHAGDKLTRHVSTTRSQRIEDHESQVEASIPSRSSKAQEQPAW